jgi:hypothetical protein
MMDTWSLILSVLIFLVFYQVFVRLSKRPKAVNSDQSEQIAILMEKFDRLDRAVKYELSDMSKSLSKLQNSSIQAAQLDDLLQRLERIENHLAGLRES